MSKTKKSNENVNQLEEYIKNLISEELKIKNYELKDSEAKLIVKNIIVEIDKLTAKRVKEHFIQIADYIKNTFKED